MDPRHDRTRLRLCDEICILLGPATIPMRYIIFSGWECLGMLHKTRRSRLRETGAYIWGSDPRDEWEFVLEDRKCRIVNGWRSGIALFVDDIEVGRSLQFFSVTGLSPLLAVDVSDGQGRQRRVEVYVRAIIDVKIQVRVDGIPIHHGFL